MLDLTLGVATAGPDGVTDLRYERTFPRPIDIVWSAITDPARIADWLGACELEPWVGGRLQVRVGPGGQVPIVGQVIAWQQPTTFACTWAWPGGTATAIRFDFTPDRPAATRVVFTHTGLPSDQVPSVLPGWHLYLERLDQALAGAKPDPDFTDRHAEIRALYGSTATPCQSPA